MEWLEFVKAIGELGVLVVIAGLFLFFYYKDKKQRDEQFKILFEKLLNKEPTHVLTEEEDRMAKQIDESINARLQNIVNTLRPSRVFLIRYHNGGKGIDGIPFLKFSVTNECTPRGVRPVMTEYQNQFRSSIYGVCNELDKKGRFYMTSPEDIKNDEGSYALMLEKGYRSIYCKTIVNATGYTTGFVAILYKDENNIKENVNQITKILDDETTSISALLTVKEEG